MVDADLQRWQSWQAGKTFPWDAPFHTDELRVITRTVHGMTSLPPPAHLSRAGRARARAVGDAIRSGWVSSAGPAIGEFEASFAAFCEAAHGVAVMNGTAALTPRARGAQRRTRR